MIGALPFGAGFFAGDIGDFRLFRLFPTGTSSTTRHHLRSRRLHRTDTGAGLLHRGHLLRRGEHFLHLGFIWDTLIGAQDFAFDDAVSIHDDGINRGRELVDGLAQQRPHHV